MRLASFLALALVVACQDSDVSREVGARCSDHSECDDRCLAPGAAWPGGFCTVHCEMDADCPVETVCIEEEGGVCAFICFADPGCEFLGTGYLCRELEARGGGSTRQVCRGS